MERENNASTRKSPIFLTKFVDDFRWSARYGIEDTDSKYFHDAMSNVATLYRHTLRATPGIGLGVAAPSYPPVIGTGEGNYTTWNTHINICEPRASSLLCELFQPSSSPFSPFTFQMRVCYAYDVRVNRRILQFGLSRDFSFSFFYYFYFYYEGEATHFVENEHTCPSREIEIGMKFLTV